MARATIQASEPTYPESLMPIEAEALMLAMLLNDNRRVDQVADILRGEDFADAMYGRIYDRIVQIVSAGQQANPITVDRMMNGDDSYIAYDGWKFLCNLTGGSASASLVMRAREQADIISDSAARRRLLDATRALETSAADHERPLAALVDEADAALVAAVERREITRQADMAAGTAMAIDRIRRIKANDGKVGASTGLYEFDQLIGGFEPGQLIIVAGRPGMGKTAFACSVTIGLAREGHGVFFASQEMSTEELHTRILCDLACRGLGDWIPFEAMIKANTTPAQDERLAAIATATQNWPIEVDDRSGMTIARLSLIARRTKRKMAAKGQTLRVLVVDYLQLMAPEDKRQSAYEAVTAISKGLKSLAKDLGIAIVALAQLSRAVEQREDKRPQLADLRDSGQIEQDADAVIFLYREEYYLANTKPKPGNEEAHERARGDAAGKLLLICAKRRNGRTGHAMVQYLTPYQAVRPMDWGRS